MKRDRVVLGIDLTVTGGLGLAAIPGDWDLDFGRVAVTSIVAPRPIEKAETTSERLLRLALLESGVVRFAREHRITHAFCEGYLTGSAFNATKIAEVGGFVQRALHRELGLLTHLVPLSSARKLTLGKIPSRRKNEPKPPGGMKAVIQKMLVDFIGVPKHWNADEIDAWVIGNWGCSEIALCCVAVPPPPKVTRTSCRTKKPAAGSRLSGG